MTIKEIKPMNVFYFTENTNLEGLDKFVRVKVKELYSKSQQLNLEITGPAYWIYYGVDGNPQTEFTLEIAIPVSESKYFDNEFKIKRLDNFKCASILHNGTWDELPQSYGKLIPMVFSNGYQLTGQSREVFINVDFNNPENNITEIQMGVL